MLCRVAVCLCVLACAIAATADIELKEVFIWKRLDFAWSDDGWKAQALNNQQFQPENVALSGVRAWRDRLYLTLPRWRPGVPATLVSVPAISDNPSPRLQPFPSWEMQSVGNCSALQFVQAIEIDTKGQMWVLDSGRVNVLTTPDSKCPPKIVVIDLNSLANDPNATAKILYTIMFPEPVLSKFNDSLLVDLVLDMDDVLYISDASETDPGIIVLDARNNQAWKLRDMSSMRGDTQLMVAGRRLNYKSNVNALALTPVPGGVNKNRTLYFCPLNSDNLYSISTTVLRNQATVTRTDISSSIMNLGNKTSFSQGMIVDSHRVLYVGLNSMDSIARWETGKLPLKDNIHVVFKDMERLQWPSGFAIDTAGNMWVVSNRLQNFVAGQVNLQETNYRIMRATTNTKSYLYPDDSVPEAAQPTMHSDHMHDHNHDHDHDQPMMHDHDHDHDHDHNHTHSHAHGKKNAADSMTTSSGVVYSLLTSIAALIFTNA